MMMPSFTRLHSAWLGCTTLLAVALTLICAAPLQAQVLSDPRVAEFDPSPDHGAVLTNGDLAVLRYELDVYPVGGSMAVGKVDMGKPSPGVDGKIRFDFSSQVTNWSLPGGNYEARVTAVGSQGEAASDPSNPFTFTTTSACSFSLSFSNVSVLAAGGNYAVEVTTSSGCAWVVSNALTWVTIASGSGTGPGTAAFQVQSNSSTSTRTGTFQVAGKTMTVMQDAAAPSCSYALSPTAASVPSSGGGTSFTVSTGPDCAWAAATTDSSWIAVIGGGGLGNGAVSLSVAENASPAMREGHVTVAGQTFTVIQPGAPSTCSYSVTPTTATLPPGGGMGQVSVTTGPGCAWGVLSSAGWLLPAATSGTGGGALAFSARANNSMWSRSATLTVGPWVVTVTQPGKSNRTK